MSNHGTTRQKSSSRVSNSIILSSSLVISSLNCMVWCAIARYFPTLSSRCQNVPCPGVKDRPGHICPEDPPSMSALPLEVSLSHMDLPPDFQRYEAEQLAISYLTRNESRKCQLSLHASFSSNAIHSLRWFCLLINQLTYSRGLGLNVFAFYG